MLHATHLRRRCARLDAPALLRFDLDRTLRRGDLGVGCIHCSCEVELRNLGGALCALGRFVLLRPYHSHRCRR